MPKTADDELEYIEQFRRQYRAGEKEFVKDPSESDREIIDETIRSMEHYELEKSIHEDTLRKPALTIEEASRYVKRDWLGRKRPTITDQLMLDYMNRSGTSEDIATHRFMVSLDRARSRNLIHDSEDIGRKFKECMEKNKTLETEIHQLEKKLKKCQDDFRGYMDRIQPLGKGKTETGGTEAPPAPPA